MRGVGSHGNFMVTSPRFVRDIQGSESTASPRRSRIDISCIVHAAEAVTMVPLNSAEAPLLQPRRQLLADMWLSFVHRYWSQLTN